MKTTRRTFLATTAAAPALLAASGFARVRRTAQAGDRLMYVGTYTNNAAGSKGIYAWRFNTASGQVTSLGLAAETDSPSFLAVHPTKKFLYAVNELPPAEAGGPEGAVTAFAIDAASGKLTQISRSKSGGRAPAHLLVDPTGTWVVVGNYGTGPGNEGTSVAVFAIGADGTLGATPTTFVPHAPRPKRLDPAAPPPKNGNNPVSHPHCVLLSADQKFLFVAEKGWDQVVVYKWNPATGALTLNDPPAGESGPNTGPRHMALSKDGKFLYCCLEQGRGVNAYAYDAATGTLTLLQTLSTLPADARPAGSTAEIEVHPDGKYLYVSNRGHNSLALFAIDPSKGTLTLEGHFPTGGGGPRHFAIDPTGAWVITENQQANLSVVQKIDRATGALTPTDVTLDTPAPVCLVFV
jgi:6-phosphogluconolactonase